VLVYVSHFQPRLTFTAEGKSVLSLEWRHTRGPSRIDSLVHKYKTRVVTAGIKNVLAYKMAVLITSVEIFIVQASGVSKLIGALRPEMLQMLSLSLSLSLTHTHTHTLSLSLSLLYHSFSPSLILSRTFSSKETRLTCNCDDSSNNYFKKVPTFNPSYSLVVTINPYCHFLQ